MSSTFAELAQTKVGSVEAPKPIPTGFYQAIITGPFVEHRTKSQKLAARFPLQLVAPHEGVDAEELEARGGLPEKPLNYDFYMTPEAMYRFTDFAKAVFGVGEEANLIEALETVGTAGTPFMVEVKHEQDQRDPSKFYTRIDNPAPLS